MFMRISLIVAILAGLGAGVWGYLEVTNEDWGIPKLKAQRDSEHGAKLKAQDDASKTHAELTRTQGVLAQTQRDLKDSQASEKKAKEDEAAQVKIAADLKDRLTKTEADLESVQADLASYKATGKSAKDIGDMVATIRKDDDVIAALNAEKVVFIRRINVLSNQLAQVVGSEEFHVRLPANLKGSVVAVDPKWEFVVLNVGEDQGVLPDGQLLVSRDSKLVAKVIVRTIYKNSCIANVMPNWKLGEVFEKDVVTPAYPAS
jgi:hypothetical protein